MTNMYICPNVNQFDLNYSARFASKVIQVINKGGNDEERLSNSREFSLMNTNLIVIFLCV